MVNFIFCAVPVQMRGVTKEDLNNVIKLIQDTMQSLITFEKRFTAQKGI